MNFKDLLFSLILCSSSLIVNANICNNEQQTQVIKSDCEALKSFYLATNGDHWENNKNWISNQPVKNWYGIQVKNNRVTEIRLPFNQLRGSIPAEIGNLVKLESLLLRGNELASIPPEIRNLTELESLDLNSNKLTSIPSEIKYLIDLKLLDLGSNMLTGSLWDQIGNLTKLKALVLQGNQLDSLSPKIGNLTELVWLILNNNQFEGPIPTEIENLTQLRHLMLQDNRLSGQIPNEIGDLPHLISLYLNHNRLTGSFTADMIAPILRTLYVQENCLEDLTASALETLLHQNVVFRYYTQNDCGGGIGSVFNGERHDFVQKHDIRQREGKDEVEEKILRMQRADYSRLEIKKAGQYENFQEEIQKINQQIEKEIKEELIGDTRKIMIR